MLNSYALNTNTCNAYPVTRSLQEIIFLSSYVSYGITDVSSSVCRSITGLSEPTYIISLDSIVDVITYE